MKLVHALPLALAVVGGAAAAGDPAIPQAPPPAAQAPAPSPLATPGPAASPAPASEIEDFVPSEKVSADDAVAFPVDI